MALLCAVSLALSLAVPAWAEEPLQGYTITLDLGGVSYEDTFFKTVQTTSDGILPISSFLMFTRDGTKKVDKWFADEEHTKEITDTQNNQFKSNATIYAVWKDVRSVSIETVIINDGENPLIGSRFYELSANNTLAEGAPSFWRDGYALQGWSMAPDGDELIDFSTQTFNVGDKIKIYAIWQEIIELKEGVNFTAPTLKGTTVTPGPGLTRVLLLETDGSIDSSVTDVDSEARIWYATAAIEKEGDTVDTEKLFFTPNPPSAEEGMYAVYYRVSGKGGNYCPPIRLGDITVKMNNLPGVYTITIDPGTETFVQFQATKYLTDANGILDMTYINLACNSGFTKMPDRWYLDKAHKQELTAGHQFTEDSTIYPTWKDALHILIDWNHAGAGTKNGSIIVPFEDGGRIQEPNFSFWQLEWPEESTREGYSFKGRARTPDATEIMDFSTETFEKGKEVTLYVVWEKDKDPTTNTPTTPTPIPTQPVTQPETPSETPSTPSTTEQPVYKSSTPATEENLAKDNWAPAATESGETVFKHTEPDGTPSTGVRLLETSDGKTVRYIFNNDGTVVSSQKAAEGSASVQVTIEGEVLVNGNLYFLNPDRDPADPRTCYVMTDYLRIRDNYAGQTYYDKDGIPFTGWMKNAEGGLRYQTRIPQPDKATDLYLIVWRVQDLPACQHPDHPGDPAYFLPAGRYFFDDEGVLVQEEGWHDGKDGKEYYTNANGMVTNKRTK